MGGYAVDTGSLEACQQAITGGADLFGALANTLSQHPAAGSYFGSLPASGQLARLTGEVNDAGRRQLAAAQTFLQGTDSALDQVLENYLGAEAYATYMASNAVAASQGAVKTALNG